MAEKIFPSGMYFEKRQGSPDYVIGSLNIKVPELIPFLEKHRNNAGYVNIDILIGKESNKPYCELNTWQPKKDNASEEAENQKKLNNFSDAPRPTAIDPVTGIDCNAEDIPF